MRSILKYDTNKINVNCNSSTKKNIKQKISGNATVRDNPNLLKSEGFFHSHLPITFQTHIVTSQPFAGLQIAPLMYFLSQ